jgi:hypothetical protein
LRLTRLSHVLVADVHLVRARARARGGVGVGVGVGARPHPKLNPKQRTLLTLG